MNKEYTLLIGALNWAVSSKAPELDTDVDWQAFLSLAGQHALTPLVCDGLQKAGVWEQVPPPAQMHLKKVYVQAVYLDSQQAHLKEKLQRALENEGIEHIFLKGSCLKASYPIPALRTMSDIDILIHTRDYKKLDAIALSLGGKSTPGDGNHKNYTFPGSVLVEFHPNLLHHATPIGTNINPGWQYAKIESPTCSRELTEEGFYLNTICHLANHFVTGGVGVRFILDVWVNMHLRQPVFDRDAVNKELLSFGLLEFTQKIEALSELWFGDGEASPLLQELGEYIFTSSSHGTTDRAMLNAMSLSQGGSRMSALFKKAFYPRAELEDRYPWCKNKPVLLPAAWCCRAFQAVTKHGDLIIRWGADTKKFDKSQITENQQKLQRFGIHKDRHKK